MALGTIADMAPLDGVNHILCRIGLEVMHQNVLQGRRIGIEQLLLCAGCDPETPVNAGDVGFKLGPRLNAAGRLGTALVSEEILSTRDPGRAKDLAILLHSENSERRRIEKQMTEEAFAQISRMDSLPQAFVLHEPHWHSGVVGIVASRVLEK